MVTEKEILDDLWAEAKKKHGNSRCFNGGPCPLLNPQGFPNRPGCGHDKRWQVENQTCRYRPTSIDGKSLTEVKP